MLKILKLKNKNLTAFVSIVIIIFPIFSAFAQNNALKPDVPLVETYWKLLILDHKEVIVLPDLREPYMTLRSEKNRIDIYGGCNYLHGDYVLTGNKITFNVLESDRTTCPATQTENAFLKMLKTANAFKISGEMLTLMDTKGISIAEFQAIYLY